MTFPGQPMRSPGQESFLSVLLGHMASLCLSPCPWGALAGGKCDGPAAGQHQCCCQQPPAWSTRCSHVHTEPKPCMGPWPNLLKTVGLSEQWAVVSALLNHTDMADNYRYISCTMSMEFIQWCRPYCFLTLLSSLNWLCIHLEQSILSLHHCSYSVAGNPLFWAQSSLSPSSSPSPALEQFCSLIAIWIVLIVCQTLKELQGIISCGAVPGT